MITPNSVFNFEAVARAEGNGGLRVSIPAAIVRGLVHVKWRGRWLDVLLDGTRFKAAVRPHPRAVMFGLPKRIRGDLRAGDLVRLEIQPASGPRAPRARRIRGVWQPTTPTLSLSWL